MGFFIMPDDHEFVPMDDWTEPRIQKDGTRLHPNNIQCKVCYMSRGVICHYSRYPLRRGFRLAISAIIGWLNRLSNRFGD